MYGGNNKGEERNFLLFSFSLAIFISISIGTLTCSEYLGILGPKSL